MFQRMKTLIVFLVAAESIAVPVQAQMSLPTIDPMVMTTFAKQDVLSLHLKQIMEEQEEGEDRPARRVSDPVRLTFQADPARTRANLQNFVKRTPDPVARQELQSIIRAQPTLMEDISAGLSAYGFDSSNMGDSYALWWINAWLVSEQRDEDPDRATIEAVKRQVYAAFSETPAFADASDAQRQEYAEALQLQAILLGEVFEQLKTDPAMLSALSKATRKGALASGLDLTAFELTRSGFTLR